MEACKKFRTMLEQPGCIIAPGVYDALSALAAEKAGVEAVVMGGYGVSASRLARPDIGLLTMTEMAEQLKMICDAVSIPVIADGDTGYGNPVNVERTVREYEHAGAAAILLEDQEFPKRCGHMAGKTVIPAEEHVLKLKAAIAARQNPDFVIIARCDARGPLGLDEAIRRGHLYLETGVDMLFIEAPQTVEELERIAREFRGAKLVANMIEGGKTPEVDARTLGEMGFKLVFWPCTAPYVTLKNLIEVFKVLKRDGTTSRVRHMMFSFSEFNELVNLERFVPSAVEKR
ncbi:MAG: isocitrate lyase/PEP mutase family protein [Firmicutes bacterium]|nr:isocitrate lyase/PEP mutase family protein [Candidatus Fermentithermobacillaceae bacterium]